MKKLRLKKTWLIAVVLIPTLTVVLGYLFALEPSPHVVRGALTPLEVKQAVKTYGELSRNLSDYDSNIEVILNRDQIQSVMNAASHLIPRASFDFDLTNYGVVVFGSLDLGAVASRSYLNFSCLFIPDVDNAIDSCAFGQISLPGWLVKWISEIGLFIFFESEVLGVFEQLLSSFSTDGKSVYLSADNSIDLKSELRSGVSKIVSIVKSFRNGYSSDFDHQVIANYIDHFAQSERINRQSPTELIDVFSVAFDYASNSNRDPVIENEYVLWAVAIAYANHRFAELIKVDTSVVGESLSSLPTRKAVLGQRRDLTLHFLYSAIIERVGNESFANHMGELKELFDSNKGGTGFDVSDLSADVAGAKFARFITSNYRNANHAQSVLKSARSDVMIYVANRQYTKPIPWDEFESRIGSTNSAEYRNLMQEIEVAANQAQLYQTSSTSAPQTRRDNDAYLGVREGQWFSIDTHIHTKFSDGRHTIAEVAQKAMQFGCDVIAITDHADGKLKAGSLGYFKEIEAQDNANPELTIISGIEWNLPPYKGREHATLLFPQGQGSAETASQFRQQFDNYQQGNGNPFSSVLDGLTWLEDSFSDFDALPVTFYNHPSRKMVSEEEIYRNLSQWAAHSNVFIGFSGAPGHQRMSTDRLGAYRNKFKTVDRWDPIVSQTGGVWDQLLADGHRVWGARAPSDFHSPNGDFWPCQFSETKVYARSKATNDILNALRQGAFFASHGKVLEALSITMMQTTIMQTSSESQASQNQQASRNQQVLDNNKVIFPGDVIYQANGNEIELTLALLTSSENWKGKASKVDEVELIITRSNGSEAKLIALAETSSINDHHVSTHHVTFSNIVVDSDMALRFVGRSKQSKGDDYMFYANPIFVKTY